jgi:predicted O-methyltransferase YrrM
MSRVGSRIKYSNKFYTEELLNNSELKLQFLEMSKKYNHFKFKSWEDRVNSLPGNIAIYYSLVRELRPKLMVETGTATGSMTSFILAALHENDYGNLISIDLRSNAGKLTMDLNLEKEDIGYWIPAKYKDRWNYKEGDAKVLLPEIFQKNEINFFIHDSLHTRTHMMFEYAVARALMKPKSIIASDDILWNNIFDDFLKSHNLIGYSPNCNPNIGVTVNDFDSFETNIGLEIVKNPNKLNCD